MSTHLGTQTNEHAHTDIDVGTPTHTHTHTHKHSESPLIASHPPSGHHLMMRNLLQEFAAHLLCLHFVCTSLYNWCVFLPICLTGVKFDVLNFLPCRAFPPNTLQPPQAFLFDNFRFIFSVFSSNLHAISFGGPDCRQRMTRETADYRWITPSLTCSRTLSVALVCRVTYE